LHPVIRILCFLVYCGFVAFGNFSTLLFASALFGVFLLNAQVINFSSYLQHLKRLKWFLLSILLVYFWFTPGQAVFSSLPTLSPSYEGLKLGAERVIALIYIVFALHVLIKTIATDSIIDAILWLLEPLRWIGLPHKMLAVRISLTLQVLDQVQVICAQPSDQENRNDLSNGFIVQVLKKVDAVAERVTNIFVAVIQSAELMPAQTVAINTNSPLPPVFQWLYPMILLLGFMYLT